MNSVRRLFFVAMMLAGFAAPAHAQFKPPSGQLDPTTLVGASTLATIEQQASGAATQGALGSEISAREVAEAQLLPITQLASQQFAATNAIALRSMADRAADRFNLNEYFVAGDPDDTQSVVRMYAAVTIAMNAGRSVSMDFPRLIRVSSMPQLQVPRGAQALFNSSPIGGTEIYITGGSNGIDAQLVNPSATVAANFLNTAFTRIGVGDFQVTKASTAPKGYDAVRIAGLPNSAGGDMSATYTGRIIAAGLGFGGTTTNPWLNAVHILDTNYYRVGGAVFTATGPANGEMASGTSVLVESTQTSSSNYAVDGYIDEVTMNGGFAGLRTLGHVEGVHATKGTVVGAAYGAYFPAWLSAGTAGSAAATYTGVYGAYFTQYHINARLRGIYCEYCTNLQVDPTVFIATPDNGSGASIAADATLPPDTNDLNPTLATSSPNLPGYSWAGIDCPDCTYSKIVGPEIDGTNSGYANGIRIVAKSLYGETAPQYLNANDVSNTIIVAVNNYAMVMDNTAVRNLVANNNAVGDAQGFVFGNSTSAIHQGNEFNGAPVESGCANGVCVHNLPEQFNALVTHPYGGVSIGGTNRGVLDLKLAGSTQTSDARIELFAPVSGNPTSSFGAIMTMTAGTFNLNSQSGVNVTGGLGADKATITNTLTAQNLSSTGTIYDGGSVELGTQGNGIAYIDGHTAPAAASGVAANDYDERFYGKDGVAGTNGQGGYHIMGLEGLTLDNGPLTSAGVITDQSLVDVYVSQSGQVLPAPNTSTSGGIVLRCPAGNPTYAAITVPLPAAPIDKQVFHVHAANCTFSAVTFTSTQSGVAINTGTPSVSPTGDTSAIYDVAANAWLR